jgi:hypothetical protein
LTLLADREEAFELACREYAEAESLYRVRYARAFLEADGAVEFRKQTAIIQVQKELTERDRAEAVKEFTREKLRDCQSAVSARQSLLNATLRTSRAFG